MFGLFKRNAAENKRQTQQGVERTQQRWFGRILGVLQSSNLDDSAWDELEEILISSDVGVECAQVLIDDLRSQVQQRRLQSPEEVYNRLKESLAHDLEAGNDPALWLEDEDSPAPYVILMVGVNGVGKTTSIAKLANRFTASGKKVVIGAADTFRAAASEQLEVLGQRVGVDVISHQSGADPGAVTYDAFQASKARGADVLIIDTAGRLHTKANLMEELKKIRRVLNRLDPSAPHQVILTLDATTGLNGLAQAESFTEAVGCTGVFLAKLDGTARGGIALAVTRQLGVPILFIGTGEGLADLAPFETQDFIDSLLAPVS